jgi:hypothetical protein
MLITSLRFLFNSFYYDFFYKQKITNILSYKYDDATIYYTRIPTKSDKKILVFLAGGVEFKYTNYIDQTIYNLRKYDFPCFVYENMHKLSFKSDEYIAEWIRKMLCQQYPDKEIILIGFSIGGTIGSHIIGHLTKSHLPNINRLITYDTPHSLNKSLKMVGQNWLLRFDIVVSYLFKQVFERLYGHLKNKISTTFWQGYKYIKSTSYYVFDENNENKSLDMFYKIVNMNYKLPYYIKMYNIHSTKDLFIDYYQNKRLITDVSNNIDYEIILVDYHEPSHCSDMYYNDNSTILYNCIME